MMACLKAILTPGVNGPKGHKKDPNSYSKLQGSKKVGVVVASRGVSWVSGFSPSKG